MPKRQVSNPQDTRRALGRDAEGTKRSAAARRALKAGLLHAPEPDKPLGRWKHP